MATGSMGTTIKYTPPGGTQKRIGKLTSIGEIAPDSQEIDVTTLDAAGGYRQYMQGLRDAGTLEIQGFYDSADAGQSALRAAFGSGETGSYVIEFTDGSTFAFSAFVKALRTGAAEVDGAIGFGAALRITGGITAA